MLRKLHTLMCIAAVMMPACETFSKGTVTGLSFLPLSIAVLWGLVMMCFESKPSKPHPRHKTVSVPRVEVVCKGRGWNE